MHVGLGDGCELEAVFKRCLISCSGLARWGMANKVYLRGASNIQANRVYNMGQIIFKYDQHFSSVH